MTLAGTTLYELATLGGAWGVGTIFRLNTDGTGFTNLHNFTAFTGFPNLNSDGTDLIGELVLSGNTVYGTAYQGGPSGNGTIFRLNTDGTGFAVLHGFSATSGPLKSNSDGAYPNALILSGSTLYGTANLGGTYGKGTVFRLNTNNTDFQTLFSFIGGNEGANPAAGLVLSGNTLYGTTAQGGSPGNGTVFAVNTDGTGFTTLHSFTFVDGAIQFSGLFLSGNSLYGTTYGGGSNAAGTIFTISLPAPPLAITRSGQSVILTWATNPGGFTLQFTTNLVSPFWKTVSPDPIVFNGQNLVVNAVPYIQEYYRLSQ